MRVWLPFQISFFAVRQRQTAAIVGRFGSKSTITNLISRFWDVSSGNSTIGSIDVSHTTETDSFAD